MLARKHSLCLLLLLSLAACQPTKRVVILIDGKRLTVETQAATVDQVLGEQKIQLGPDDRVDPPGYTPIERTATVQIVRVLLKTETAREPVEFSRRLTLDEALPQGTRRVIQLGANGENEITLQVTLEDGHAVSRRETSRRLVRAPQDEITTVGTQNSLPPVPLRGTLAYLAHGNAWVMRNSSGDKRPLTVEGDLDGRVFDLSPDGMYLLFTRLDPAGLNTTWVVDTVVLGEKPRRLPVDDLLYGQWAPDGSGRLAFSTGVKTRGAPGWKAKNDLYVAAVSGLDSGQELKLEARQVLAPSVPAPYGWWGGSWNWSPDGQVLAYGWTNQVGLIDVETGLRRSLKLFADYDSRADWIWTPQVAWSPDSRFVVASVHGEPEGATAPEDSSVFDVWVLARDNSLRLPLLRQSGMWASPLWSPRDANGESKIAYGVALVSADSERSRYALWTMNRDGSGRALIYPKAAEAGLPFLQLAWSPDAGQLAAVRDLDVWLYNFGSGLWSPLTANADTRRLAWR